MKAGALLLGAFIGFSMTAFLIAWVVVGWLFS
jgi:hypothetical protein